MRASESSRSRVPAGIAPAKEKSQKKKIRKKVSKQKAKRCDG
jgi:hypothetical protein